MQHKPIEVESRLFSLNIIQLVTETDAEEYAQNESKLIQDKTPYYIQHQLDAGDLTGIHAFIELSFLPINQVRSFLVNIGKIFIYL